MKKLLFATIEGEDRTFVDFLRIPSIKGKITETEVVDGHTKVYTSSMADSIHLEDAWHYYTLGNCDGRYAAAKVFFDLPE